MTTDDTIVAISSAVGPGARMIVRVSGTHTQRIAAEIAAELPPAAGARRCELRFADLVVPGWIYLFVAPRSYTGEDLAEFHIPGNPLLAKMLLTAIVQAGARQAEAGEFTARAYFSGRIDLTEAEGVAATISAHGEEELRAARQLMAGELADRLKPAMESLAETLGLVEAGIDFSDEDVSFIAADQLLERVRAVDAQLDELLRTSGRFERLTHEPTMVLVGRPNAGKSTLLNALAGRERSVVSPRAGTTRDLLSAEVKLKRGLICLIDAAGLEEADEMSDIDRQMKAQAQRAIESADHVLLVMDATDSRPPIALSRDADLVIRNKADLANALDGGCPVSALTGHGMDELRGRLDRLAFGSAAASSTLALNARHIAAIAEIREALDRVAAAKSADVEIIALELRQALDALGRVLGQVTPDDVLGRIFSTFCIGK